MKNVFVNKNKHKYLNELCDKIANIEANQCLNYDELKKIIVGFVNNDMGKAKFIIIQCEDWDIRHMLTIITSYAAFCISVLTLFITIFNQVLKECIDRFCIIANIVILIMLPIIIIVPLIAFKCNCNVDKYKYYVRYIVREYIANHIDSKVEEDKR